MQTKTTRRHPFTPTKGATIENEQIKITPVEEDVGDGPLCIPRGDVTRCSRWKMRRWQLQNIAHRAPGNLPRQFRDHIWYQSMSLGVSPQDFRTHLWGRCSGRSLELCSRNGLVLCNHSHGHLHPRPLAPNVRPSSAAPEGSFHAFHRVFQPWTPVFLLCHGLLYQVASDTLWQGVVADSQTLGRR